MLRDDVNAMNVALEQLKALKKNYKQLQLKLLQDEALLAEHNLLLNQIKQSGNDLSMTPTFKKEIAIPFASFCQQYDSMKQEVEQFIGKDEIEKIESNVSAAAALGDSALNNLRFFSAYQSVYQIAVDNFKKAGAGKLPGLRKEATDLQSTYNVRASDYNLLHMIFGIAIVVGGIGIPLLIGSLIFRAIDKISTSIKIKQINAEITTQERFASGDAYPMVNVLKTKIKHDPEMLLRQSFFKIAKTRNQPTMRELEVRAMPGVTVR